MNILYSLFPGISRVISNATPLIIIILFSKIVSTEELGVLNYFLALITLIGILTDFGLSEGVQRYLSTKKSPQLIFSVISLEFFLCFIGGLLLVVLDILSNGLVTRGNTFIVFLIVIFSSSNVIALIFNSISRFNRSSFYYLLSSLLFIGLTYSLYSFFNFSSTDAFLWGRLISWVVVTILPLIDYYFLKLLEFRMEFPKGFLKYISNNMVVDISYSIFNQWDSIIIINVLGAFQNGVYKSVAFLASVPYVLSVVIHTKLLPEYSRGIENGNNSQVRDSYLKITKGLILLSIFLVIVSIFVSKFVISLLYTEEIAELGSQYFIPLLIAVSLYVIASPSIALLLASGREVFVRNLSILQTVLFVLISLVVVYNLELIWLAITMLFVNLIYFLLALRQSSIILKVTR